MTISPMKRRTFIAGLGGAAAWPLAARGQQPEKLWRIGMLETIPPELNRPNLDALRRGLQELGYVGRLFGASLPLGLAATRRRWRNHLHRRSWGIIHPMPSDVGLW
jgi:hypothetical protein